MPWQQDNYFKTVMIEPRVHTDHILYSINNLSYSGPFNRTYSTGNYSFLPLSFQLVRQGNMVENIILYPGLMISFMILFAFFLPREAPIRLIFSTVVMLTIIMFLNMINTLLPNSN